MTTNRRELLPYRELAEGLGKTVKDPWRTGPVLVNEAAVSSQLDADQLCSVRIDPELSVDLDTDGVLGRSKLTDEALEFSFSRRPTAQVRGPEPKLRLLQQVIGTRRDLQPAELEKITLPKDLQLFAARVATIGEEIETLLTTGRALAETIERLVCALYGVPVELTDEVVAHAIERAAGLAVS